MKKHLLLIGLLLGSGTCQASFNEGVAAYEKGDYQTALRVWKAVAERKSTISNDFEWHSNNSKNTAEAQYGLGLLYWQGKGVTQDYREAEKWLTLAAKSGHKEAQLKLAYLHLTGLNGKTNSREAIKWFEKSAQQGNVDAQYNLGLLYFKGSGVTQNRELAKKWLTAAAKQGEPAAKTLLAELDSTPKTAKPATSKETQSTLLATETTPAEVAINHSASAKPLPAKSATPEETPGSSFVAETKPAEVAVNKQIQANPLPAQSLADNGSAQTPEKSLAPEVSRSTTAKASFLPTPVTSTVIANNKNLEPAEIKSTTAISNDDAYGVQVFSSTNQKEAVQFMKKWHNELTPLMLGDKRKNAARLFVVVYGTYPSPNQTRQSITGLPSELRKNKPWPIKINSLNVIERAEQPVISDLAEEMPEKSAAAAVEAKTAEPPTSKKIPSSSVVAETKPAEVAVNKQNQVKPLPAKSVTDDSSAHTFAKSDAPEDLPPGTAKSAPPSVSVTSADESAETKITAAISNDDAYGVQVFSSTNQKEAVQFMKKWGNELSPLILGDKRKNTSRLFVVVYGAYPSPNQTRPSIAGLPSELRKNKPWPIKINSLNVIQRTEQPVVSDLADVTATKPVEVVVNKQKGAKPLPAESVTDDSAAQTFVKSVAPEVSAASTAKSPPPSASASSKEESAETKITAAISNDDAYGVQVFSSTNQKEAIQFMKKWRDELSPLMQGEKRKNASRVFVVVYGQYSSPNQAKQSIANLPAELRKNSPWSIKLNSLKLTESTEKTVEADLVTPPATSDSITTRKHVVIAPAVADAVIESSPSESGSASADMDGHYAIQLFSSTSENEAAQFMVKWRNQLEPLVMTDKTKNASRIFIVLYGKYSSQAQAKQNIESLPAELKKRKPWAVKTK